MINCKQVTTIKILYEKKLILGNAPNISFWISAINKNINGNDIPKKINIDESAIWLLSLAINVGILIFNPIRMIPIADRIILRTNKYSPK